MARLENSPYAAGDLAALRSPQIIVVDMINGFAKEGSLADPYIQTITPAIQALLEQEGTQSLFIADAHEPDAMEFASFPVHCLKGSAESEIVEELQDYAANRLEKNSTNTFHAPGFQEWLEQLPEACDIVITGCCTDLCVLQLALSLQSWIHENQKTGLKLWVPADGVETYDIPQIHPAAFWNEAALQNMAANGIQVVSTFQNPESAQ